MSRLLEEKRKTRGLRMAELIGDAAVQDDAFWSKDVWAESDSDNSFTEEEEKPDVFDSDFDESEDDGDNEESSNQPGREIKLVIVRLLLL